MSEPLPRAVLHRGSVLAAGLVLERRLVGELEARRRVLDLIGRARAVLDVGDGYLVLFAQLARLDADLCLGTPVVEHEGRWLAVPLRPDERARLHLPSGSLVRVREGRLAVEPLDRAAPVDVAQWLDASAWSMLAVEPLGSPPAVAEPTLAPGTLRPESVREVLGDRLPPLDPKRDEILRALAQPGATAGPGAARRGAGGEPAAAEGLRARLSRWWADLVGPPAAALPAADGAGGRGEARPAAPARPGRLRRWLLELVARSRLAQLLGARQAKYLAHTLELFESHAWDEALRHAIPFASLPGAPAPPALSVPSPRAELQLRATPSAGATSSMTLGDDLYARFRALYQQAARALEAEGRIEEAAYVLFELLGTPEEGVAMLERHQRYALAARMAEGRDLAAGLVIRLWFLAGEPARAILVARRTGAFADAVQRLDRSAPTLAKQLRLVWADRLAAAGDYVAAVDAVWPVEEGRRLARAWLDRAIELGGPVACRMLPRKLAAWPDDPTAVAEVREAVLARLEDPSDAALPLRRDLGEAWSESTARSVPAWNELGRALTRRLMLDAASTGDATAARRLLVKLDDPALQWDVSAAPPPPAPPAPPPRRSPIFEAHERGLCPVHDAVVLPNGSLLLALGDAGLRLVDARGRTLRAWEHPASQLVLADSGARALALIQRGQTWSLRRLDLVTGRADPWCDARFERGATSYDGAGWFVATDDALALVDAQAEGFEVLWRVGLDRGHHIEAIGRGPRHVSMVVRPATLAGGRMDLEIWTYELTAGGPMLRRRRTLELDVDPRELMLEPLVCSVHAEGRVGVALPRDSEGFVRVLSSSHDGGVDGIRLTISVTLLARASHLDLWHPRPMGMVLERFASTTHPPQPRLELRGSTSLGLRPLQHDRGQEGTLVFDPLGRVILLDADGGVVRHWLS